MCFWNIQPYFLICVWLKGFTIFFVIDDGKEVNIKHVMYVLIGISRRRLMVIGYSIIDGTGRHRRDVRLPTNASYKQLRILFFLNFLKIMP